MYFLKYKILITLIFISSYTLYSQTLKEATEFIECGQCEEAIDILQSIVNTKPKDSEASYELARAYLCTGNKALAEKEFLSAKKKGSNAANFQLAELALKEYKVKEAENYISEYRKGLKKSKKGTPDFSVDFDNYLEKIKTMLDRVEQIVIIDSIEVDADLFFKHYSLAKESGTFNIPVLNNNVKNAEPTVMFETGDNRERFWAIENDNHTFELVNSNALFGGEWTEPNRLGLQLNEGGDANYPFLMSDGMTLYFANDGENSIGGYDIFITRRDGEQFLQPTNIGFPYNSPADDYLLAIDESKGIGWWATNRNGHCDSVTIYSFIPSDMRINYDVNDENLASKARIDSYRTTWGDKDYSYLKTISNNNGKKENFDPSFTINIPQKGIYTSLSQFKSTHARSLMQQYLIAEEQYLSLCELLQKQREEYKNTHSSNIAQKILFSEKDLMQRQQLLHQLRNEVISAETAEK